MVVLLDKQSMHTFPDAHVSCKLHTANK